MLEINLNFFDPLGRPTVIVYAHVVRPLVRTFIQTFQNLAKQNKFQAKTMFTTGETVGIAEWIMDDTCLVSAYFFISDAVKWQTCLFSVFQLFQL